MQLILAARSQWNFAFLAADFGCSRICMLNRRCADRVCTEICA